ncbi:MAG: pyridoxamine 5'-phosphate oxidase [Bdellovibrionales bacterium]
MTLDELLKTRDPMSLFARWYAEAQKNAKLREPTAMALATANKQGLPSLRTVLLKSFSAEQGFVFYTNYQSHKGQDLTENPQAALLFYWDSLFQQIRVQGPIQKVSREESEAYWNLRPFESQVAGWLSRQSRAVTGSLDQMFLDAQKKWQGKKVPCPEHWGGFALKPSVLEFWIGHPNRLHTSVRFELKNQTWVPEQLYP